MIRVSDELGKRRKKVQIWDTDSYPESLTCSLVNGALCLSGEALPKRLRSVYLRATGPSPFSPRFEDDLATRPRGLFAQWEERLAFISSALLILQARRVVVVNTPEANAQHSRKPYQLELLRSAGLPVPKTLATNDAKAVKAFVKDVGAVVYKPLAGGASVRRVTKNDLARERLAALALAPVLFQEMLEGVSVRVYVVGKRVVASAEIHSDELDYRRDEKAVVATRLSKEERRAAVSAAAACGMRFSGVDLIRGARGFHVLECNPSPMFAVFEEKTGLDVAGPLANYLSNPGNG
ncbi:MAG: ATP-grasp domain-containing protein [Candidatus Hydrogenedentes bacterium]|nr:ATP-grasp domain-containing protein [Candidatus Hydrogenedentota bacterium]